MQHSDVPSNIFNWLYRTQSSKQRVITSFVRCLETSSRTLTPQSKGKKEKKEADGWHQAPVSPFLTPLISNEEQEELLLPQQPWSLFEAIWRQLKEKE